MIGWEIDWVGATKRVAPGLGPTGRAGGPLVHPLFLSPIIIPWPPDVMRTQTSLNGSFSAAQSAEKAARFCDECYRSITFSQERKLACERACAFESFRFIETHPTPPPFPLHRRRSDRRRVGDVLQAAYVV